MTPKFEANTNINFYIIDSPGTKKSRSYGYLSGQIGKVCKVAVKVNDCEWLKRKVGYYVNLAFRIDKIMFQKKGHIVNFKIDIEYYCKLIAKC